MADLGQLLSTRVPAAPPPDVAHVPLESIIITDELDIRPPRPRDHDAEQRAIDELARELAGAVGVAEANRVLQRVVDAALRFCAAGSAGISLLEVDGAIEMVRWQATAGRWATLAGASMRRDRTTSDVVLERDVPMLLAQPTRHYGTPLGLPRNDEVLLVPFHYHDRPVGTLWVVSHDADACRFDAGDLRFMANLASVAAEANRLLAAHPRQEATTQARLEAELADSRLLQAISAELITADDEKALYSKILDAAVAIVRSDFASLQVFADDSNGGVLRLIANRGFSPEAERRWATVSTADGSCCAETLRTRQRVIAPDVREAPFMAGTADLDWFLKNGILAAQTTPLVSRAGHLVGAFSTHWRSPHVPAERDLRLLDILAREAADLIERQQAEDLLRESDRRKEEFLATLAHELRNPLAPIRNAVEILRLSRVEDPNVNWARELILRQTDHLTRLVDDLLDVSRINRDRLELHKGLVPLAAVLDAAIETSQPIIAQHRQSLTVRRLEEPILVEADATRLSQVFANLLNNAAKFSNPGGRIELLIERLGDDVAIRVRDHGIGVDPAALPHLFDLFGQKRRSFDRGEGGLGIGLALSKRLVEMHGGSVSAESEGIGGGSQFSVRLPIVALDSAGPSRRVDLSSDSARPLIVLVVDDHDDGAVSMSRLLRTLGHETRMASDGAEGFRVASECRPEVALIDLGMPIVDGYELARLLRAEPWGQAMMLVAVTGWGQESDKRRTAEAGFDHHLTKPVDLPELVQMLSRCSMREHAPHA
jgi:signal transduction histidine kinase/CheY-like chemotaxis protein